MSTTAFIDLCNDPWGEILNVKLNVMVHAAIGGTMVVHNITDTQEVLNLSVIARMREKKHGIMQGQSWQVQTTNINNTYTDIDFSDAIAQIVVEFEDAAESEAVVQGRVFKIIHSTDGTMTFEVHDTVIELLNYQIPRDIHYQATGWLGDMKVYSKDPSSKGWDSTAALVLNTPADVVDESFYVTFISATAYDVTRDHSAVSQRGTISLDFDVDTDGGTGSITIPASGWSADSFAYSAGDIFIFHTAKARTAAELSPIQMVIDLIEQAIYQIPIISETPLAFFPFHDTANWTAQATAANGDEIGGFWVKGTAVSRMIQDALKIVHGAIYSVATGQLALWVLQPNTDTRISLNGDPGRGLVSIIEASTTHDLTEMISSVIYEYLDLEGEDAAVTATDEDTVLSVERIETVRVGWRVRGLSIESAANIHLNRLKSGRKEYTIKTTLAGLLADVGSGISVTEPDLNLAVEASDVTEISMNLLNNSTTIKAHIDPVSVEDYAIVGVSTVGGTEVVW